ncbi:MAG: hypothetical protein EXQ47_07740 [Bryobacterales bacterium]|nr:hypothetical protein [Bryobacterales bacterium]
MSARLLLAIFLAATGALAAPPPAVFAQMDQMVATLGEITGWQVKRKVPSEVLTKEKFQRYLATHIKDSDHDKAVHAEELALKMFGLVPQDFNLARETSDLLSEQAAAFYDYRKKRLYLLDSTPPGEEQKMALVHELAHALADQQHELGKYLNRGSPDSDEITAREAVMEGQATWLTWAYEVKQSGGKAEVPEGMIDRLTRERDDPADFPVLEKTPLYMRESLLFPYNAGARFQDAVYRKLGREAFNAVFARGPFSTQQILHPEQYFGGKKPPALDPPGLEKLAAKQASQYRGIIEGSIGEFDHAILLRQYVGELQGKDAAEHWRGGWFRLYEHKKDQRPILSYVSEWDSPAAARRYFELYQRVLKGKWKKMEVTATTPEEVSGTGDSGRFTLRLTGTSVQSFEGLP